ncbi:MAG: TIGR03013 family PEP-CTERM/XrtA system glycosyltransferase [Desulfobacteraceae bacterium]|nr:TIGR03013 family PEP-CTERM/XrtA system glycosyltransferase [Desulfobacteraceae bacterium]
MSFRWVILILGDSALAVTALYLAAIVRLGTSEVAQQLTEFNTLFTAAVFILAVLFSSHLMEAYGFARNTKKREVLINILFGTATAFFLLSVVYYLDPEVILGRGILAISLLLFAVLQFCWHSLYLVGKNHPRFSQRVLILGTGELAAQMGEIISSNRSNFVLAGYAACHNCEPPDNKSEFNLIAVPPDSIVGDSSDLLATAQLVRADIIVVALSERRGQFPLRDVLRCKLNSIQIMDAPALYERVQDKLMLESITPSWFIFSDGFRRTSIFSFFKRAVDIVLSITGLLLTLPFIPLIALAIKLDSSGPVLFRQVRIGNKEHQFLLYKFRSMRLDAEQLSGAVWAQENDPRVTMLGRFLRNSRIDEIPQLINVLKGDMSFVGPRPERPEFVEKLKQIIPYYSKRHFIRPGLTGWAQVRYPYGASVEDAVEKLRYDLCYIKNIGPFLDTLIFFETIKVVLFGRGVR